MSLVISGCNLVPTWEALVGIEYNLFLASQQQQRFGESVIINSIDQPVARY